VQVNACEITLRLGSTVSGQVVSAAGPGFQQLLKDSIQQVVWGCSAPLVCAVADKFRTCVQRAATEPLGMQHMQRQWKPCGLSSRNIPQHHMRLGHVESALDVVRHAWEVLSADAVIGDAAHHSSTILSSVKHCLIVEGQECKQDLDAQALLVLLHVNAASAGLQVRCGNIEMNRNDCTPR
jgi:hypothetical protein